MMCLRAYAMHTHEIVPRSKGGLLVKENQVRLCPSCHTRVHEEGTAKWQERLIIAKQYYEEVFISDS